MINKDSVMSILYTGIDIVYWPLQYVLTLIFITAKKYAVPALENACISFLENCLNSENAFMLLAKARFYDEEVFSSFLQYNKYKTLKYTY
jgi:hypothetical protein